MRSKLPLTGIIALIFLLATNSFVRAAEFKLTSIGTLDVSEALYSEMWYSGNQPTFVGTGTSDATVNVTIDGDSSSTTVDTSGEWSWTPLAALDNTAHNVNLVSEGEIISFTLTTGSAGPTTTTTPTTAPDNDATPAAIPTTGVIANTLGLLAIGTALVLFPLIKKQAFEYR